MRVRFVPGFCGYDTLEPRIEGLQGRRLLAEFLRNNREWAGRRVVIKWGKAWNRYDTVGRVWLAMEVI